MRMASVTNGSSNSVFIRGAHRIDALFRRVAACLGRRGLFDVVLIGAGYTRLREEFVKTGEQGSAVALPQLILNGRGVLRRSG